MTKKPAPWLCHDCGWQNGWPSNDNATDICRYCGRSRRYWGTSLMSSDIAKWINEREKQLAHARSHR